MGNRLIFLYYILFSQEGQKKLDWPIFGYIGSNIRGVDKSYKNLFELRYELLWEITVSEAVDVIILKKSSIGV